MTNLKHDDSAEPDPFLRPASPGESQEEVNARLGKKSWREEHPGWETYEGGSDPGATDEQRREALLDTNLNPAMTVPRKLSPTVWVIGAFLGLILLAGIIALMFYHFMRPAPRRPVAVRGSHVSQAERRDVALERTLAKVSRPGFVRT